MNNRSDIELTFLLSSGESLFIKIDSFKDSLNALFSQRKIEKSLKLLLLYSCNNRWPDIANSFHATLFPVKQDEPMCSTDLTFKWCSISKHLNSFKSDTKKDKASNSIYVFIIL